MKATAATARTASPTMDGNPISAAPLRQANPNPAKPMTEANKVTGTWGRGE